MFSSFPWGQQSVFNRPALLCACKVSPKLQSAVERPQEVCSVQRHLQLMHFCISKGALSWSTGSDQSFAQMQLSPGAGGGCCSLGCQLKSEQPLGGQFCAARPECCLSCKIPDPFMNMSGFRICFAFWLCHWWWGLYGTWLLSHLVLFSAKCSFCWLSWCDLPWPPSPTFMAMLLEVFRPLQLSTDFFFPFKVTNLVKYFKISSYLFF